MPIDFTLKRPRAQTIHLPDSVTAIRIDPTNTRARIEIARAYGALDRTDEQITAYQTILAEQPSNITSLLDLGMAMERTGRPDEAIDLFSQARDLALEAGFLPDVAKTRRRQIND